MYRVLVGTVQNNSYERFDELVGTTDGNCAMTAMYWACGRLIGVGRRSMKMEKKTVSWEKWCFTISIKVAGTATKAGTASGFGVRRWSARCWPVAKLGRGAQSSPHNFPIGRPL